MPRILQITDLHLLPEPSDRLVGVDTEYYFRQVLLSAFAKYSHFDLIIATGDLAQDPCLNSYRRLARQLNAFKTRTLCLPGNHDNFDFMQTVLNNGLISCDKHISVGNWQIIALNSQIPGKPGGRLAKDELIFLQEKLRDNPSTATLIAMHHHCISSHSTWMDSMQIENSQEFLDLLDQYPQVKAVTFGHLHQEMASKQKDRWFFSCPSTCFQFKPDATEFAVDELPAGYRVFELADNGLIASSCHRLASPPIGLQRVSHSY